MDPGSCDAVKVMRVRPTGKQPTPLERAVASLTTLLLAAAGPVLIGFTGTVGAWWALTLFGGIALILAAITFQVVQGYRENKRAQIAADEGEELRKGVRNAIKPILELIAQLPSFDFGQRRLRLQGIAQACATAIYILVSPHAPDARANVFTLQASPDRMVWLAHVGRGETPRPFESGTSRGDAALEFITRLSPVRYPDLRKEKPVGFEGSMSDYATFISVPVWTDSGVFGMVTVDAPQADVLTFGDQYVVEVVAELMATAHEIAIAEPTAKA